MALTSCWRCARLPLRAALLQPRPTAILHPTTALLRPLPSSQSASFSTTPAPHGAALVKKKSTIPSSNPKAKGSTTLKIKKRGPPVRVAKHIEPGARRAERKKLLLANPNAPEVELPPLTAPIAKEDNADGAVFTFEGTMIETLRTLGGFELKQGWQYFYKPSTLVRAESVEVGKLLAWVNGEEVKPKQEEEEGEKEVKPKEEGTEAIKEEQQVEGKEAQVVEPHEQWIPSGGYITTPLNFTPLDPGTSKWAKLVSESRSGRRVLHGPRGAGKTVLLLQAMAWAHQRDWVVLTIPNAMDLTIGHTDYEHDLHSNLWLQKQYTMSLLQRFLKANAQILKATPLSQTYTLGRDAVIPQSEKLYALVELGALEFGLSWDVLRAVLHELSLPGRPPVLFTLDNLNYISLLTAYRDTAHTAIHAHDLALPNIFLDYLRGARTFWRGVTIAATTSRAPAAPALAMALAGEELSPYKKLDPRIPPSIRGAPVLNISPLTKPQAKALMQYYKDNGLYQEDVDETLAEKWVLSSGIPKELMRVCLRLKY